MIFVDEAENSFDMAAQFLDTSTGLSGETISSLFVVGILCLLSFYIAIRARFADPLKKPKGILFLAEVGVTFFDNLVENRCRAFSEVRAWAREIACRSAKK